MRICLIFFVLIINCPVASAQEIRGAVRDRLSRESIPFASILLNGGGFQASAVADSVGYFFFPGVLSGRYLLQVSSAGYEPLTLHEVVVNPVKQTILDIQLQPRVMQLNEVTIRPETDKEQSLNPMATVSIRTISVEEARRFAGGFDDPARLVSGFAGVSGNVGNNAIAVRGNNPQALQWKLEGIEISNPNHLGDMRAFGGGTVTALSAQLLAHSDFLTGAMPAEYGNALSGVFDLSMREGNHQRREHTLQVGVVGIDIASEGPFKKGGTASYLFNYRYSTLALVAPLLADNAGGIKYQDLSFKLHFPTKNAGTFSVWGLASKDRVGAEAKRDSAAWIYDDDRENHRINLDMAVGGISHCYYLNPRSHIKTVIAVQTNGAHYPVERLDGQLAVSLKSVLQSRYRNATLSSYLNTKLNSRHTHKTGVTMTQMHYDLQLQNRVPFGKLQTVAKGLGTSLLFSVYSQSALQMSNKMQLNAGLAVQYFTLTNRCAVEPRVGLKRQTGPKQTLSLAYGLHSRLERLNYYFIQKDGQSNRKLDFTKAHHWVLGYDWNTSAFTHLKIEAYYQRLFGVPVMAGSSFSMLNQQGDWFFNGLLESKGKGINRGVDVTFEKYLSRGYYYLMTASVFKSDYRGGDKVWRGTRYNRGYAFNFLIGKEWYAGREKQRVFGVNARLNYQGGERYSPVDEVKSVSGQTVVFDETKAFSMQYPAALTAHFTASYRVNKQKSSRELALKILNVTQYKEYMGFRYNYQTEKVDLYREPVIIPNLSYRIDF